MSPRIFWRENTTPRHNIIAAIVSSAVVALVMVGRWLLVRIQQQGAGAPLPQGDASRRRENLGALLRSLRELREGRRQLAHFHVGTCGATTLPRWRECQISKKSLSL